MQKFFDASHPMIRSLDETPYSANRLKQNYQHLDRHAPILAGIARRFR
jgi:hypothetical protein